MSLLFNMQSRFIIAFLPRSKHLLVSWLQSQSSVILEPKKIKSVIVSIISPSICHEVMGPDAMIFFFWMLSFKPAFSLSLSLSPRGSLVLRFLPWESCHLHIWHYWQSWFQLVALPRLAFCLKYSAYKFNKKVTIYSIDILLSKFGTSLLFHVQF